MRALIIGVSGGIGAALARALERRGWQVVGLSRRADGLDVTDEAAVARVLGAVAGEFDLILVATGGLEIGGIGPEKTVRALDGAALAVAAGDPGKIRRCRYRDSRVNLFRWKTSDY